VGARPHGNGASAAQQYLEREGRLTVGRGVVETVVDGDGQEHLGN
jgi:hypothetical protein